MPTPNPFSITLTPAQRCIVALDVRGKAHALDLVDALQPHGLQHVKVGMSLFYEAGLPLLEALAERGLDVFVDLKLHDIPNTVARTVDVLIRGGATFLNVHAQGGEAMLRAAQAQALATAEALNAPPATLIAVTLLTSFTPTALASDLQQPLAPTAYVQHLAQLTQACGLAGVVCSSHEASVLRATCGESFLKVTPGIRPASHAMGSDDQARILTPRQALQAGATHLVVGRPIYAAPNPEQAFIELLHEVTLACSQPIV
ncbi:MAG: orotidine-5'-phosphate decarboxylase [Vampirovibrionales bacterium]